MVCILDRTATQNSAYTLNLHREKYRCLYHGIVEYLFLIGLKGILGCALFPFMNYVVGTLNAWLTAVVYLSNKARRAVVYDQYNTTQRGVPGYSQSLAVVY